MLKQWARRRKLSRTAWDPNSKMRCPVATRETETMTTPEDCYQAWKSHFETDAWRAKSVGSMCAVSAFYFHWAGEGDITRPAEDVQFDRLVGISSCYQYFMLREGEVLMRPYSCWCPSCFGVAVSGPGLGTCLTSEYEVRGCSKCDNGLYSWHNASCRAKSGAGASSPDQRARAHGHELAAAAQPGQWVLIEAFNDDVDEMWLARTVAFSAFGVAVCCKKHLDGQKNVYGTRFNTGDYMVAVQWYERLCESGNGERREFVRGRCMVDVINSTELRMIGFEMTCIGVFPSIADEDSDDDEDDNKGNEGNVESRTKWELPREIEAVALTWCR